MTSPTGLERSILDALPITIYSVDLEGRITFVNRSWGSFARDNGAPQLAEQVDVAGSCIWDAITEGASRDQIVEAMAVLRAGRARSLTWEFPCSSPEEERVFLLQVSALEEGHQVVGFAFSTVDITPSHRAREVLIETGTALARAISVDRVLQEVGRQLRRVLACEAVAVAISDADPDQPTLAYQTGFEEDDAAVGAQLADRWADTLRLGLVWTERTTAGTRLTAPMENESVRGAITVVVGSVTEPSRLTELERVLTSIAAQTAAAIQRAGLVRRVAEKRRLEAVGEVAAGVAHELRNPLFGISSAAQLLRFRVREDPVIEKNVGRILREVERLNGMVTSLLEYGRPAPVRLAAGDPDHVWDEVLEMQRGLLEAKGLIVDRSAPEPRAVVHFDAAQLAQVFVNLLVNAVDAAPEASTLVLTSSALPHGGWRTRLRNEGAPIPADVLPHVFELFYSTKAGGTGIGLALCQRIVEEHGGSIGIESDAERGTTVSVTLPPPTT